jgi:hypothetical protein
VASVESSYHAKHRSSSAGRSEPPPRLESRRPSCSRSPGGAPFLRFRGSAPWSFASLKPVPKCTLPKCASPPASSRIDLARIDLCRTPLTGLPPSSLGQAPTGRSSKHLPFLVGGIALHCPNGRLRSSAPPGGWRRPRALPHSPQSAPDPLQPAAGPLRPSRQPAPPRRLHPPPSRRHTNRPRRRTPRPSQPPVSQQHHRRAPPPPVPAAHLRSSTRSCRPSLAGSQSHSNSSALLDTAGSAQLRFAALASQAAAPDDDLVPLLE